MSSSAERMSSGLAASMGARIAAPASLQIITSILPQASFAAATIHAGSCALMTVNPGNPTANSWATSPSVKLLSWHTIVAPRAANSTATGRPTNCSTLVIRTT